MSMMGFVLGVSCYSFHAFVNFPLKFAFPFPFVLTPAGELKIILTPNF